MPRLRPGDGGVRCSPKAADVVDQVVDAPIVGQRGPATTSPARSSGTRRPPERAHVHRPRVTKARSPDHTLNHASLVHHMSRPSIVRLGCSVVGVRSPSLRSTPRVLTPHDATTARSSRCRPDPRSRGQSDSHRPSPSCRSVLALVTRMSGSWAKPERLRGALAAGAPLDELCGTSERRMPRGAQFRTR